MSNNQNKNKLDQQPLRDAAVIQKEVPVAKPATGFNQTTVEMELAQARNKVASLNNRLEMINQEMTQIRTELETANKLKGLLEAAKGQVMEIDRLKGIQNGNK